MMLCGNVSTKRLRILDAALHVFTDKGFHNATIAEVAQLAHVGKGTVYLYFEGKDALLVAILDELADHMIRVLDELSQRGAQLKDVVGRLVNEEAESGRTRKRIFQLLAQQPFLATLSLQERKQSLIEQLVGRLASRIQLAMNEGVLRSCDAILLACVFLSLPGAISLYSAANPHSNLPESLPQVAEGLSEMLWLGLQKETQ